MPGTERRGAGSDDKHIQMRKIVCTSMELGWSTNTIGIAIGNIYEVIETESHDFEKYQILTIVNDLGRKDRYNSMLFSDLSEWRAQRLNDILTL
jgi:hypothetical protein